MANPKTRGGNFPSSNAKSAMEIIARCSLYLHENAGDYDRQNTSAPLYPEIGLIQA